MQKISANELDALLECHELGQPQTLRVDEHLPELVRVYRKYYAPCLECGLQRCAHRQSPNCQGFI